MLRMFVIGFSMVSLILRSLNIAKAVEAQAPRELTLLLRHEDETVRIGASNCLHLISKFPNGKLGWL